jgi:tetratricopeptide (TPR) repeat protein
MMAAIVGMVILAVRARRLEQEQGLASSARRLVAVSILCSIVVLLVLGATVSAVLPLQHLPATAPALATEPTDPIEKAKWDALQKRKTELYAEIARINAEIDKLSPVLPSPAEELAPSWYSFDVGPLAHFLVPILIVLGIVALVTLGDPTTLLRPGWAGPPGEEESARQAAMVGLDRLSELAERGEFQEGLRAAGSVDVGLLDKFDKLDWAYLKCYCAVQVAALAATEDRERQDLLLAAVRDLETLLEQAPNRGEAVYLLATANALAGRWRDSFAGFVSAASLLPANGSKLPFPNNQSVCLLRMAEEALGKGDAEEAARLFDEVTKRGALVDRIPTILVKVRLLKVRRNLQEGNHDEARQGIDAVRKVEGLDSQQRRDIETVCDALETLIAAREGDPPRILEQTESFINRHLPPGLPPPDEDIVEEYLDAPVSGMELRLSPQVFRSFLFLQAEARSKIASKSKTPPTEDQVQAIARPLFRALQFELRQRDVLAALGGLYYWFVPERRKRALEWLEAAVAMGAEGRIARKLLDLARAHEIEHREALDWFRSASIRFLHDPTIARLVRQALIEELGRFQEFQPLLIDIESAPEIELREPTLRLLRQRAGYLEKTVSDLAARKADSVSPALQDLLKDYQGLIARLDESTGTIAEIESKLVREFGKLVMS